MPHTSIVRAINATPAQTHSTRRQHDPHAIDRGWFHLVRRGDSTAHQDATTKENDMTRSELLTRLREIEDNLANAPIMQTADGRRREVKRDVHSLIEDIDLDGVLDVQAPIEIAKTMKLPRATK